MMMPYWESEETVIFHGNALEVLPELTPGHPGQSARQPFGAIVTDPPYAIPTVVAQGREITRNLGDLSIVEAGLNLFLSAATRTLGRAGRMFVFCDGTSYPVIFRLLYGSFQTALLVWDKGQIGMGREFRKSHELILHAWKSETPIFSDGVGRADILKAAPVSSGSRCHPAQKPLPLIAQLLAVTTGPVLDPFMGSGTTLVAARNLGRRSVGIDIEERYCEIAARRLEAGPRFAMEPRQQQLSEVTA